VSFGGGVAKLIASASCEQPPEDSLRCRDRKPAIEQARAAELVWDGIEAS
jgi:hypothetical protein